MPGDVLDQRALNRATLERQMLLRRWEMSPTDALRRLVGLQAQTTTTWYLGLWTRLVGFRPDDLATRLTEREVVRIALMRGTIHLVTDDDCGWLRPVVQPVLDRVLTGNYGKNLAGVDLAELAAAGRELVERRPLTFSDLGKQLAQRWPDQDPTSLAHVVRASIPLVQVPPRGVWGASGPAAHTSAEAWLGRPMDNPEPERMVLRYLAAFGPASVKDVQVWSGLSRLNEIVDRLRDDLVVFRGEDGRELLDLPDAPRPDPGTPAPPRFLYDFDNLLRSHADRSRVVTDPYRRISTTKNGMPPSAFLIDGVTRGTWKITRERGAATLEIHPFDALSKKDSGALTREGARLLAFSAADARDHDVRILDANT